MNQVFVWRDACSYTDGYPSQHLDLSQNSRNIACITFNYDTSTPEYRREVRCLPSQETVWVQSDANCQIK